MEDQACHDGQNWVLVAQVPGISQSAATAQPAAQPQAQAKTAPAKKKTTAVQAKQTTASTAKSAQKPLPNQQAPKSGSFLVE